ncbi:MAG: hypothetical protein JRI56_08600 [Deltaproteobacteria bacterium]|nr:hypothetical protein [Deltaproteobacteria bacterium]
MENSIEKNITAILNTVVKVITNPVGFFRSMPKTGGFVEPLIFMLSIGVVAGIVRATLAIVGLGFAVSFSQAIALPWQLSGLASRYHFPRPLLRLSSFRFSLAYSGSWVPEFYSSFGK